MAELRRHAAALNGGDLSNAEAMLMNQATALQSLFARLAERGMSCTEVVPFETNMRMALRAQSQCRATLETLAAIKNPPMVIAKQANVTTGPQQVNNGVPGPRVRETESEQDNFWGRTMANGWTPERRARQSAAIRRWKPWERSTGPRTAEGKAKVSRNADKGDIRGTFRAIRRLFREQDESRSRLVPHVRGSTFGNGRGSKLAVRSQ